MTKTIIKQKSSSSSSASSSSNCSATVKPRKARQSFAKEKHLAEEATRKKNIAALTAALAKAAIPVSKAATRVEDEKAYSEAQRVVINEMREKRHALIAAEQEEADAQRAADNCWDAELLVLYEDDPEKVIAIDSLKFSFSVFIHYNF